METLLARDELDDWPGIAYHGLQSVNLPKHANDEEGEHKHEGTWLGELVNEHLVKIIQRHACRRVGAELGMVARQFGDGRPQALSLTALRGVLVCLSS